MPAKHVEEAKRFADEFDANLSAGQGQAPPAEHPKAAGAAGAPPADQPGANGSAQPAPGEAAPGEEGDWQQKYLTLKGKYDSEVPQLSVSLREARAQLSETLSRVSALEQGQQQPQPAPTPQLPQITDEDIENFGPELTDFIKRQATVIASDMTAEVRAENQQLRQQIEQTAASTGQVQADRYFTRLSELVPDYEAINVNPAFLGWLGEIDEMAGVPRQAFLNSAFEARDPVRTAKLFNAFKTAIGQPPAKVPPPPPPSPGAAPPAPAQPGNGDDRSISPASGSGGGLDLLNIDDPNAIWTGAEIKAFTNDILRGLYKGREADQARVQASIDRAIVEGRVRM